MPLTPIDESRGDRPRPSRGQRAESSVTQRLWGRAKELLANLPVGGSRFVPPEDNADESAAGAETETVSALPTHERPFTAPARNDSEPNQAEPVSIETDTDLTISLPDNPEASITSDVWERVER